jgi:hypothetical protein
MERAISLVIAGSAGDAVRRNKQFSVEELMESMAEVF